VERLEFRELLKVVFQQVAELPQQAAAFRGRHARPGALVEGAARGTDGAVYVFLLGLGDVSKNLAGGGVVDIKGLAGGRGDKAAIDEHAVFALDEVGGAAADAGIDGKSSHGVDLECFRSRGRRRGRLYVP